MVKHIILLMTLALMVGCSNQPAKVEYKTTYVPTYIVPKAQKIERPTLYSSTLTPTQLDDIGELSKAYLIDNVQLKLYICLLESELNEYSILSQDTTGTTTQPVPLDISSAQQECLKSVPLNNIPESTNILQAVKKWIGS